MANKLSTARYLWMHLTDSLKSKCLKKLNFALLSQKIFIHYFTTIKVHGLNWLLISGRHQMKARNGSSQKFCGNGIFFLLQTTSQDLQFSLEHFCTVLLILYLSWCMSQAKYFLNFFCCHIVIDLYLLAANTHKSAVWPSSASDWFTYV